jgi:hypothetical protein
MSTDTPIQNLRVTVNVWTATLVVALVAALCLFAGWRVGRGERVIGPTPPSSRLAP